MLVAEFVEKFLERWNVKAEKAFTEDCKEFLKCYERGDTLHFALTNIIMDWQRKNGAPAIADIRAACQAVLASQSQTVRATEPAYDHAAHVERVFRSSIGQRCCDAMAGGDLEYWLEKNKGRPTEADIADMCDPAKLARFIEDGRKLRDMPVRSEMMEGLYQLGKAMHRKNIEMKARYGSMAEQGRAA